MFVHLNSNLSISVFQSEIQSQILVVSERREVTQSMTLKVESDKKLLPNF